MLNDLNLLPSALARLPGETLDGLYRLDEVLGIGGMGVVFRGLQLRLERPVAIKILDPQFAETDGYAQRFRREARSIARLDHVNCLQLYEYGTTGENLHYIVMPLFRGRPLDELVGKNETVAPRCAMKILDQVLAGLGHAHRRGLIHRDLKPSNLIIEQRGHRFCEGDVVRIVDFGIAKIVDDDGPSQSRAGMLFGTPAYMSPEQVLGKPLDARSDLYAAGLVAHRLIAGSVPHRGRTVVDQLQRRASLEVPRLPATCPSGVADVVAGLCARDPRDRFADAQTARAAVLRVLEDSDADDDSRWRSPAAPVSHAAVAETEGRIVTLELTNEASASARASLDEGTRSFDGNDDMSVTHADEPPATVRGACSTSPRSRLEWAQSALLSALGFSGSSPTPAS